MHASTLGIMPPRSRRLDHPVRPFGPSAEMSVLGSFGSSKIPSTSVNMISLSALRAAAKCPATASALML